LLGFSQAELAAESGVSQSLISQVENGTRHADEVLVQAVAAATGTPLSFFAEPPPAVPEGSLRFRKRAGSRPGATKRVKALFDEAYRIVSRLQRELELSAPALPSLDDDQVDGDGIEAVAHEAREALGQGTDTPVSSMTRACERAGIFVVPLHLPGEEDQGKSIGHFGVSCWPGRSESALVGYFPTEAGDFQRFTLAHEVAHLILHSRRRNVQNPEPEANRFAGAFLLPRERLEVVFASQQVTLRDLAHLKARWGISIQALVMRSADLGLIDDVRKQSLFKQIGVRGWRRAEPVTVHPEQPELLWRLLAERFGSPVAFTTAGNALGLPAVILRSLAPPPPQR
jgi:Zn-dependent peptidase ImmA (M78 family)/transcriptional regulator with XRE-family HTH domain